MATTGVFEAPGRVNLIGEHTDYNDGFVLPLAIPRHVRVTATRRDDRRVVARSTATDVVVDVADPGPGAVDGWGAYVAGVVWALRDAGHDVAGFDFAIDSDVPVGAGLSSSAALSCAVGLAAVTLSGVDVDRTALALAAQRAEHEVAGAPVGIMDQMAVLHGRAGHAILVDTRSLRVEAVPLRLTDAGLTLLVIDTRAPHRLVDGEYAARRRSCEEAARALGVPALRDATRAELARLQPGVPLMRARHVVTENARVRTVAAALTEGEDPRVIGPVLTASHESLRDDFQVSCPELDTAVAAALDTGAHGARLTGGGFGGSAIALVDTADVARVESAVRDAFAAAGFAAAPEFFSVTPADGARRVA